MALIKQIKMEDGVVCEYHRISYMQIVPNNHISINVESYQNASARQEEQNGLIENPYKASITYEVDYDEKMGIKEAYKYLQKHIAAFDKASSDE